MYSPDQKNPDVRTVRQDAADVHGRKKRAPVPSVHSFHKEKAAPQRESESSRAPRQDGVFIENSGETPGRSSKYPCPCCGYATLPVPAADAVAYICPVCYWENDVFISRDDEPSDENYGMTLTEARANFKTYHACDPQFLKYVRDPLD